MLGRLFLLFTLVPLVELMLLVEVGQRLGLGPTLFLVVVTGLVGAALARREGARTWRRVQEELAGGRLPGGELLSALLVLLAGALLVTPGVLTDAAGLLILVRPARSRVVGLLRAHLMEKMEDGELHVFTSGSPGRTGREADGEDAPEGWHRRPDRPDRTAQDEDGEDSQRRIIEM